MAAPRGGRRGNEMVQGLRPPWPVSGSRPCREDRTCRRCHRKVGEPLVWVC